MITPQCKTCKTRAAEIAWWCLDCLDKRSKKLDEDAKLRIADYVNSDPMSWDEWVSWLGYYGLPAGIYFTFALQLYIDHGCELPFEALLCDHPELEVKMANYVSENVPEALDMEIHLATRDRLFSPLP